MVCGTVTLLDDDGERLQTVRFGRKLEKNKETLRSQVEDELGSILNVRPDVGTCWPPSTAATFNL